MPLLENTLPSHLYQIDSVRGSNPQIVKCHYTGPVKCPHCSGRALRIKARFVRKVRSESQGNRRVVLHLTARKYNCRSCKRYFNQRFPGILPHKRCTEEFRREVYQKHVDGLCLSTLAKRTGISPSTVERWFHEFLDLELRKWRQRPLPRVLGIDEHFFTKRKGFATTFCDLSKHRVFDVALGRSESDLGSYLRGLKGRDRVRVVCMDLSTTYRSLVRRYFPNAQIVADRFHVIRLVNHHFLAAWKQLDPIGRKNRGLLSLMRRHEENMTAEQHERLREYLHAQPGLEAVYDFKQALCQLLLQKNLSKPLARVALAEFLDAIQELRHSPIQSLQQLGRTLDSWKQEIALMWRWSKNNGITEGFHNKMEMISRRAFGFRNFQNYRLRVRVLCG